MVFNTRPPVESVLHFMSAHEGAIYSIARSGWDGATLRSVADEGGWSVGIVQHYFRRKSDVLSAAVHYLMEATYTAASHDGESSGALDWLRTFLETVTPHPGGRSEYWRVWICFWAQAQNDPSLAQAVMGVTQDFRQRLETVLRAAQEQGSIRADIDPQGEAALLAAAVMGLGIMPCLDPSFRESNTMVDRILSPLIGGSPDG
jgi:AcrR family transcriptional regulator